MTPQAIAQTRPSGSGFLVLFVVLVVASLEVWGITVALGVLLK